MKRPVVLDTGSGADDPAGPGSRLDIAPYRAHADGTTWIHATRQTYFPSVTPSVLLKTNEYYWFYPLDPRGEPLFAMIPAGSGDILYKDLVPVDPSTLADLAVSPPAPAAPAHDPKLDSVRAALDDRETARVNIGILGASAVEGAFVSSFARTTGQRLAAKLRAMYPTPGVAGGRGFIGIPSTAMTTSTQFLPGMWPITNSGMSVDPVDPGASTYDIGGKHACMFANYPAHLTVTLDQPVTSFEIRHSRGPAGSATAGYYKIDGGSAVTFNTYAATGTLDVIHVLLPANESIEIGWTAGPADYVIPTGVVEYDGDEAAGIQVHNLGHAGMTIAQWQDGYASTGSWLESVDSLDLDCLILQDLGANDAANGVTPAAFETQLTNFIAVLRGGGVTCPIIVSALYDPSGGLTLASPWSQYVTKMQAVAAAEPSVAFVDLSSKGVTTVTDTYNLFSKIDHVHPTGAGTVNAWIADIYAAVLGAS